MKIVKPNVNLINHNINPNVPLDHTVITFEVNGISEFVYSELENLIAYTKKEDGSKNNFITPDSFDRFIVEVDTKIPKTNPKTGESSVEVLKGKYSAAYIMKKIVETNKSFYDLFISIGIPEEDARYILPKSMEAGLILSMTIPFLKDFLKKYLCNKTNKELKNVADQILYLSKKEYPGIFNMIGPDCVSGECLKGELSCGNSKIMKLKYRTL